MKGKIMSPKTRAMLDQMLDHANAGHDIYPHMFQPLRGQSNTVSAAIRAGKKLGLIEENGKNGLGQPKYRAVEMASTHAAPAAIQ